MQASQARGTAARPREEPAMEMERYRREMEAIERERINFLNKIDLVQPSFEEQHQLEWGRRYQEEELSSLRSELDKVLREVEAETKLLGDREEVIRGIREEQRQDRIKIQTLLALSQPITPDITVVFRSLAPNAPASSPAPLPPPTRHRPSKAPTRLRESSSSPPPRLSQNEIVGRRAGADTTTPWSLVGGADSGREPKDAVEGENRVDGGGGIGRQWHRGGGGGSCGGGGGGRGGGSGGGGVTHSGETDDAARSDRNRHGHADEGIGGRVQERAAAATAQGGGWTSFGTERDDPQRKEYYPGADSRGHSSIAPALGRPGQGGSRDVESTKGSPGDAAARRGGRGGRRPQEGRAVEGQESGVRGRDEVGASRVRCTRGYQEHLERRLELAQRHLRDVYLLGRSYEETLARDRQEREMQVKVQKENISVVAESLRRRTVEVDGRLAGATEDYLRLRHRAKEAHAVSAEEQRQCDEARRKSRAEVENTLAAAEAKIDAVKQRGRIQLEESTLDLRKKLGVAEEALQRERSHHAAIKRRHEERVARARKGVLLTRRRYHKLVRRRAEEVVHLGDEMSALRRGVTELERRMFAAW